VAEFFKINCNKEKVALLLTEIWETCSTNQKHETQTKAYMYWRERDHCG